MAADDVADIVLSAAVFFEIFGTGDFDVVTRFLTASINFSTAIFFSSRKQTHINTLRYRYMHIQNSYSFCRTMPHDSDSCASN